MSSMSADPAMWSTKSQGEQQRSEIMKADHMPQTDISKGLGPTALAILSSSATRQTIMGPMCTIVHQGVPETCTNLLGQFKTILTAALALSPLQKTIRDNKDPQMTMHDAEQHRQITPRRETIEVVETTDARHPLGGFAVQ
jgi:hypothetical protein